MHNIEYLHSDDRRSTGVIGHQNTRALGSQRDEVTYFRFDGKHSPTYIRFFRLVGLPNLCLRVIYLC